VMATGKVNGNSSEKAQGMVDFVADIRGFKLWSPETPFLYDLEIKTKGDTKTQRFGMRSFASAKEGGVVELNGKTYFMRGTNVCIFRFFEDADRGNLPWNQQWVTKLHTNFKDMNWNSIRYCIGFPPERWYEIADSVGFLIQDEYPIWKGTKIPKLSITSNEIANEYTSWMRERWTHPCVVIWDGQNESVWDTTAIAINKVRPLDLSNRPWDNGWAMPASPTDMREVHIYLTWKYFVDLNNKKPVVYKDGFLKDLMKEPTKMSGFNYSPELKNPVIFNEYCWMWLNRDGSPTTLSENLYANLFPNLDTPEKRLEFYAKFLGMETEYWRSHRQCAAVMHFCGLGHSRPTIPRGQTSDNFTDIKELKFDKYFYKYVRPAFNPVGIMLNFWDEKLQSGSKIEVPVNLINDTYEEWNGNIKLSLIKGDISILNQVISSKILPLGKEIFNSSLVLPKEKGKYKLVAEIIYKRESIKSIREFSIE
jgi:beta-galactosidase